MIRRIADWLRERRIEDLREQVNEHMAAGRSDMARRSVLRMALEIKARSPQQVACMERARGLRA